MTLQVSVVVPTRKRPASLERALRSVLRQDFDAAAMELVVVDNDADAASRSLVESIAAQAPFPVTYVCEPTPGVASARNAAMARVRAPFTAFLDDDEEAPSGWLRALLRAQTVFGADVVFGPVQGVAPQSAGWRRHYLERFFSREGPPFSCILEKPYGCGCSLVRMSALPSRTEPFSLKQNNFGGEDDMLFAAMKTRGSSFAWAPDAWVYEHPLPERLTLRYALRRAFAYGQGPTFSSWRRGDWAGTVFWMAVGMAQIPLYGLPAAVKWLLGAPDRAFALDRTVRACGKVLWFPPFKPSFYGLPG